MKWLACRQEEGDSLADRLILGYFMGSPLLDLFWFVAGSENCVLDCYLEIQMLPNRWLIKTFAEWFNFLVIALPPHDLLVIYVLVPDC